MASILTTRRRTKDEIKRIREAILAVLEENWPMSVRQVFYALVNVAGALIRKTEAEYKGTVGRLLTEMRRSHDIPFAWIADSTRWMRKPMTHSSLESAMRRSAEAYRRCLWDEQEVYVEIWLEKDALAGVLYPVTSEWDVPLMVTRGYPSLSFLHSAAETIAEQGKPAYLYYIGDYDPSGVDITRAVEAGIRELAPDAEIHFERIAVTREQIAEMNLPTRPTKQTDSRSKGFEGESVEADAIPAGVLRSMVEGCITRHIDQDALWRTKAIEAGERETYKAIAAGYEQEEEEDLRRSLFEGYGDEDDEDEGGDGEDE